MRSWIPGPQLVAALALVSCGPGDELVEVAVERGLVFGHDAGFRQTYRFPETVASGLALVDLGGDGDLDVYALQAGPLPGSPEALPEGAGGLNRLFENDGSGHFQDVTDAAGAAAHSGYALGASAGDVNGDGLVDVFLTNLGPDALLLQTPGGSFDEGSRGSPLADPRFTSASAFGDLDGDGHLDLVVLGYVHWSVAADIPCFSEGVRDYCGVNLYEGIADRVWRGDGLGGFEERTQPWGLHSTGRGLGLALADLDDDGDQDLYIANDSEPNALFLNTGGGRLKDASALSGAALSQEGRAQAGMGVALGDTDGDGLPELLVTNFAGEPNTLYQNLGGARFRDRSRVAQVAMHSRTALGFGAELADLDRDGALDLLVANGHVLRHIEERRPAWSFAQPDQLLRGSAEGGFAPWSVGPDLIEEHVSRGLVCADLDGDGSLEVLISTHGGALRMLSNRLALPGSAWLRVELNDPVGSNRAGIGSRVQLALDDGTQLNRWIRSGTSFFSQGDLAANFGIPPGVSVRTLSVRWPDGEQTRVESPETGQSLRLTR